MRLTKVIVTGSVLAALLILGGCTYTQFSDPNAAGDDIYFEDPQPSPDSDNYYLPEPVRGAFGQLSVWGYWIEVPSFGWVWKPDIDYYWQPYANGYWGWTEHGWTWMSYEPFGWITYHYGYWHFDPGYGWYWIPDFYWFPNGVTWVHYGDFIAWAPIPPPGYHLLDPWEMHIDDVWMIVRARHFTNRDIGAYKYHGVHMYPDQTNSRVFRSAPGRRYVEERTGRQVPRMKDDLPRVNDRPGRVSAPRPNAPGRRSPASGEAATDAGGKSGTKTKEKKSQPKARDGGKSGTKTKEKDSSQSRREPRPSKSKSKSGSSGKSKGGDN